MTRPRRRPSKRGLAALLALALAAVLCAGCGGSATQTPAKAQEMELHVSFPADVKGFDTTQAGDLYSSTAIKTVYEGLMQYSYLKRPYQVEPCLANGMPQVSPDLLTYTFKIKKGVRFADDECFKATGGKGRELVAEDFIYSFKRIADVKNKTNGYWIFEGRIKGLDEFRQASGRGPADYAAPVEGLEAPDPHTLVISLTRPYPQLLFVLTMGYTAVVPREAVESYGQEFLNHPVGTGPFKLENWVRNSKLIFVRNPTFHGEQYPSEGAPGDREQGLLADAGKPLPFADRLIIYIMIEDQPRWLQFMQGQLDYQTVPKDNFDSAIGTGRELKPDLVKKGITLVKEPMLDVTYMAFNMEDPVVGGAKGKLLRQAMSLAYDRQLHIDKLRNGVWAEIAYGPLPPGLAGYDPNLRSPYVSYNLEQAKEKLAQAGYPGGQGLPVLTFQNSGSDATSRQYGELFTDQMRLIGVQVNVEGNTWPEFDQKVKEKRAQMFSMAWGADYPDAQNFLQLFYGPSSSPGPNGCNYQNPEYDRLYEQMEGMADSPARREIIRRMIEMLNEDCPMLYEDHRIIYRLKHAWLKNHKYMDIDYATYKYYRIDLEEKARLLREAF